MQAGFASWLGRFLLGVLLLFLLWTTVRGVNQIHEGNNFEVYLMAAEIALETGSGLFERLSPLEERPFVYPPSAAILFLPLLWLPVGTTIVLFSLLKTSAIAALLWGCVHFSGMAPARALHRTLLALIVTLLLWRPIVSDVGHGQVNLFVAALAILGVCVLMQAGRREWLGSIALATAIEIKATPALLLGVPLLQGRWRATAIAAAMTALLLLALPGLWFGPARSAEHLAGFQRTSRMLADGATSAARQRSLPELILFVVGQRAAEPGLYYDDEERRLYRREGDDKTLVIPPVPGGAGTTRKVWIAAVVAIALPFLAWRFMLSRRAPVPWTLDLAVLCVLLLLISPLSRRAHLVVLCYPLAWIACRLLHQLTEVGGWRAALRQRPMQWFVALVTIIFCIDSSSLKVPIPGAQMPGRPSMFFAMIGILVLLIQLGPRRRTDGQPSRPPATPGASPSVSRG